MFIIAFSLGYYIVQKIYKNDNKPISLVEPLFIYVVFGTLIGASTPCRAALASKSSLSICGDFAIKRPFSLLSSLGSPKS